MLTLIAAAFGLGLIFNAAPGPIFAATVRLGVRGGFKPALAVQLGSIVGDGVWAVLGLTGVGVLVRVEVLRLAIGAAGVVYLLWLAWQAWRDARREIAVHTAVAPAESAAALRSGMALSLTNPQNVAYWAAMASALGALGVEQPTAADYAGFFAGFMLSSVVWAFVFAALVDRVLGGLGLRWARITYWACALAFVALALASLRDLIGSIREPTAVAAPAPTPASREP